MGMELIFFFQARNKKELCGAEVVARSVKHLLGRRENLSSIPRTAGKARCDSVNLECQPGRGRNRRTPKVHWPSRMGEVESSRFGEITCLKI